MNLGKSAKRLARWRQCMPAGLFLLGLGATVSLVYLLVLFFQSEERARFANMVDTRHSTLSSRLAGINSQLEWLLLVLSQADKPTGEALDRVLQRSGGALNTDRLYVLSYHDHDTASVVYRAHGGARELSEDDAFLQSALANAFSRFTENGVNVTGLPGPHRIDNALAGLRLMITRHQALPDGGHVMASVIVSPLQIGLGDVFRPNELGLSRVGIIQDDAIRNVVTFDRSKVPRKVFATVVRFTRPLPASLAGRGYRLSYEGTIALGSRDNVAVLVGVGAFGVLFSIGVGFASAAGHRRSSRLAQISGELQDANQALNTRIAEVEALNGQLVEAHRNYRDIFENAIEGLFQIAPDGRFVQANPACARILGFDTVEALLCSSIAPAEAGFFSPQDQADFFRRLAEADRVQGYEIELLRPDGTRVWVSISVIVVRGEDGAIRFYEGIIEDISPRKEADRVLLEAKEEAELANRTKTQFLANMSHELRTPLNAIIGFSEIIRRQMFGPVGSAEYVEYASDIHDSGEHLLELINDILDVSRVEAGKRDLQESAVDPRTVIHGSLRLLREKAEAKNLTIDVSIDPCLNQLWVEELALKQIMINLVSNAVKFTRSGGQISISVQHDEGTGIVFAVADNGIGIAKDEIDKVLEPFAQAERGMSRESGGTGLGLALVKSLTELHGGALQLDSELGAGTTVQVILPEARLIRAVA